MFLRRHRKHWGEDVLGAPATVVAPGAHDLLARDAGESRHGARAHGSVAAFRQFASPANAVSTDLAVAVTDFEAGQEWSEDVGLTDAPRSLGVIGASVR
jgi:hypothetical protein